MKCLIQCVLFLFPWKLRRFFLHRMGFSLEKTSYIGYSLIVSERIDLDCGARIGHFNLIRNLSLLKMGQHSSIGSLNWIVGHAKNTRFFLDERGRESALILGRHAALTNQHIVDCTNSISIGDYSTVAGFRSQLLTHGINYRANKQESAPITIGKYCLVGSGTIILKGTVVADNCVVGAGALLNKQYLTNNSLIAGTPGVIRAALDPNAEYFTRVSGVVY